VKIPLQVICVCVRARAFHWWQLQVNEHSFTIATLMAAASTVPVDRRTWTVTREFMEDLADKPTGSHRLQNG